MAIDEIIHIPVSARPAFEMKVDWINKQAKRLKLGLELALDVVGEEARPVDVTRRVFREGRFEQEHTVEVRPCILYRLSCPEPVIALPGWSFAGWIAAKTAKRDTDTGAVEAPSFSPGEIDRKVPQAVIDGAFGANGMMRCDHCRTFRNRRIGIVVQNAAGDHQIVGSACARDYLGHDYRALIAYHQHISALHREVERERERGWYAVDEYDFAAQRAAEAAAQAARDAKVYPVRAIVAAIVQAMLDQGFFARYSGSGKVATSVAAVSLLEGASDRPGEAWAAADRIMEWTRTDGQHADYGRYKRLAEPSHETIALDAYRRIDPDFAIAQTYLGQGRPLVGTLRGGRVQVDLRHVRSEEAPEVEIPTGYRPRVVRRTRHILEDREGGRYRWDTTSGKLDEVFERTEWFAADFDVKWSGVVKLRAAHSITHLGQVKAVPARSRESAKRSGRETAATGTPTGKGQPAAERGR